MIRIALLALSLAALARADQDAANPFNLGRAQDIAARPMALGGSYTAVAADASALYYNPAGLSAVKKHEWAVSLERSVLNGLYRAEGFPSLDRTQEEIRIQSFAAVMPVPTVRGGLTFAFGYYRPRTFSDLLSYEDSQSASSGPYEYRSEGTMEHYRAGMGVDLAPDLSFGLALGYLHGSEEIRLSDQGEFAFLRTYHGLNLEPSLMFKFTPRLRLGFSMVMWEKMLNLEEVYEEKDVGNSEENYSASFPFQVKTGLAYQGHSFLVAADARLNGWSQFRYGTKNASTLEKAGYKNEMILSLGGEKFIAPMKTVLRAGYTLNTLPETVFDPTYDLHRFSAGAGFLFSGALALDAAYSYSLWGMAGDGLVLDNREHRVLVTFAYRY